MNKLKFTVKCLVIVMIPFVFNFCFVKDIHSYTRVMMNELYDDGTIDLLFLGASHTYRGFNTELIEDELGINAFNASSSSQHFQGSYYLLKEAHESNGVKKVCLDVTYIMQQMEVPGEIETYLLLDYMRGLGNRIMYALDVFGLDGIDDMFFPMLHSIDISIDNLKMHLSKEYLNNSYEYVTYSNEAYKGQGFVYSYEVVPKDYEFVPTRKISENRPLTEFSKKYLYKIIEYCKENEIELIFVNPPMPDATLVLAENFDIYVEAIKKIADEEGIVYYDFNLATENFLTMQRNDYKDSDHLNGQGADKFSMSFSQLLNNKNIVFYDSFEEKLQKNPDGTYTMDNAWN